MQHFIKVVSERPGKYIAEAAGIPDVRATADSAEEAIQRVHALLMQRVAAGQLVSVELSAEGPLGKWFGHARNDPDFELYLEETRRYRQEVDDRECSNSSSTPTT